MKYALRWNQHYQNLFLNKTFKIFNKNVFLPETYVNIKRKQLHSEGTLEKLANRRAGIEPLIGHIKRGGQLGRSQMKKDESTKAAGYTAVLGFNLRQTKHYLAGKHKSSQAA